MTQGLLKDKKRHIKILKSLFEQKSIRIGQYQMGSDQEPPPTGARGKTFRDETTEAMQGKYLIGYGLSGCPIWESLGQLFVLGQPQVLIP